MFTFRFDAVQRQACLCLCLLASLISAPVVAQELRYAGVSGIMHNDKFGDGRDRWRSGGAMLSAFFEGPVRSYEFRTRAEVITPWNKTAPGDADRPATGVIGLGAFVHQDRGDWQFKYGGELVLTGSSLLQAQEIFHQAFGFDNAFMVSADRSDVLPGRVFPSLSGEVAREFRLGRIGAIRPFVEAEVGFENFLRVGGDIALNAEGFAQHVSRDPVTGFLVPTKGDARGAGGARNFVSLYLGGDYALVDGANLFAVGSVEPTHTRTRLRAGVIMGNDNAQMFYGVTRLSREFVGQSEQQVLGSVSMSFRF